MTQRICSKCGDSKPATSEFFGRHRDGLRPDCKVCVSERDRRYREANREKVRVGKAAYRQANAEKLAARELAYARSPEGKEVRRRNAEKWNKSPEGRLFFAITQLRRRAEASGLLADFTAEDWSYCLAFFNNSCAYCGATERLTQEHVVADSRGGPYTARNVIVACRPCNTSKHHSDMESWFRTQPFFSAERLARILTYVSRGA